VAAHLGRFFAIKFRAGVLYRIFDRTGDRAALKECLKTYRAAREAWAGIGARTKGVYMADITVGETRQLRGHWADRPGRRRPLDRPQRPRVAGRHAPPARFKPGSALALEFAVEKDYASVRLHYPVT